MARVNITATGRTRMTVVYNALDPFVGTPTSYTEYVMAVTEKEAFAAALAITAHRLAKQNPQKLGLEDIHKKLRKTAKVDAIADGHVSMHGSGRIPKRRSVE